MTLFMNHQRARTVAAVAGAAVLLASCSNSTDTAAEAPDTSAAPAEETFTVVASTSVWADVAEAVLDDANVEVTAIVQGSNVDPHSFEPTARDLAAAEEADLVIANGGGYDAWLYEAIDQDKIVHPLPLVEGHDHGDHDHGHEEHDHVEHDHEGHDHGDHDHDHDHAHDHGELEGGVVETIDGNEHVWFDVDAVAIVAEQIVAEAQALNPELEADATAVVEEMETLRSRLEELPTFTVAQTETIADYIIDDAGLVDNTPEGYRHAQLNHSEATAADLADFLAAIEAGEIDVLLYNPQTQTDAQEQLRAAAEEAGVQVVEIGETAPDGVNFLDYFHQVIDELAAAAEAAQN